MREHGRERVQRVSVASITERHCKALVSNFLDDLLLDDFRNRRRVVELDGVDLGDDGVRGAAADNKIAAFAPPA